MATARLAGLAPDEFGAVLGGFGQRDHQGHLLGEDQPPPEFGPQGDEDAVDGLVQIQVTVGGDEIQAFHHAQQQRLDFFGGVDQVLAVKDIFPAGFLPQVGNEFHDPLVVGQQRLEMFKNLRKGHQVLLGPAYPVPEIMEHWPHGVIP